MPSHNLEKLYVAFVKLPLCLIYISRDLLFNSYKISSIIIIYCYKLAINIRNNSVGIATSERAGRSGF
jgi:hypothetical protein